MAGSPRRRKIVVKFRKKPVVIAAVQWAGDNLSEIQSFYRPNQILVGNQIWIETLEGVMKADIGDWIIKGIKGEFYPCKPDIFALTYESAEATSDRDDDAMRDGVRVEATKDEKVNGIVRLCQDVDWTNISLMLDYLERIGSAWPHATGQLRPFVLGIRSALAEVEGK
jgi:hypothetical protein